MSPFTVETNGTKLERVNYFPRQLITADDLAAEQEYFREKLRRHNRFLHGWGVVCGLAVTAAPTDEAPWRVQVETGYALGPQGDEIYVAEPLYLNLAECGPGATTDPCDPGRLRPDSGATGDSLFVAIKYAECMARPVRIHPAGCACNEDTCEYSRIRDSFQLECLAELPQPQPTPGLCDHLDEVVPCLPCPTDPWVVLARVTLPASSGTAISEGSIDNMVRRHLYSTAVLQAQLIECCCGPRPVTVVRTDPEDGQVIDRNRDDPLPATAVVDFSKPLSQINMRSMRLTRQVGGSEAESIRITSYEINDSGTRLTITPEGGFGQVDSAANEITFAVTLRGDGDNAIRDSDGLRLDGNENGEEGGNYVFSFTIVPIFG